tara:strand:+ start:231 stop:812 length:582 start_codon:yes stop_codon:yes gene_type:complete
MKKLFSILIISLVALTTYGQNRFSEKFADADLAFNLEENKYQEAATKAAIITDLQPAVIAFKEDLNKELQELQDNLVPLSEPQIDTLTTNFRVVDLSGDSAKIMTTHGSRFYVASATPEINPFGYVLEVEREFTISIEVDKNLIYQKQTRGQTGIVPARIIWFTVSPDQLKRDQLQIKRYLEEEPGYDRSPRY